MRLRVAMTIGAVLAAVLGVSSPATAATTVEAQGSTANIATMVSEGGDYIGQGLPRYYYAPGNASVSTGGDLRYLAVDVSGGSSGDSFTMTFAPPPGETLHVGSYEDAQRAPFREAGRPGIDISGDGRGCNTITGRFDVLDVAMARGAITRLWLEYEQHCEGGPAALFGVVHIGAGVSRGGLLMGADQIEFPSHETAKPSAVAPIPVANLGTSVISIGNVRMLGATPADFSVRSDTCSRQKLAPGGECVVFVRLSALGGGLRSAGLRVPTTAGDAFVPLDTLVINGTTSFTMHSEPGDWVGGGQDYSYGAADSTIAVSGSLGGIHASISSGSDWWYADFVPGAGDIIAPGTYLDAIRYPFQGSKPGMDISGNGRGCNELNGQFTVVAVAFGPRGDLEYVDVTFEQHCDGAVPALFGELKYRVPTGDIRPPAPVKNLVATPSGRSANLTWNNPPAQDLAFEVVRVLPGAAAPTNPIGSIYGWAGVGTAATVTRLPRGTVTVAVYAVDTSGNVSAPTFATIATL
jgi:hypothetical protein